MKADPQVASSTHIIYAFRIEGKPTGTIQENFDSDGDYFTGLQLLNRMQDDHDTNMLCIATLTRLPTFRHIGRDRFNYIAAACRNAKDLLGPRTIDPDQSADV